MRLLGVTRLSRSDETSTSLARQADAIQRWCELAGHTLAAITTDDDVSGDVAPWQRPGLGPWLPSSLGHRDATPAQVRQAVARSRAVEWDGLVVVHLDRLSRRAADLLALIDWCKADGRHVFDVSGVDYCGPAGTVTLGVLAGLAQAERERMSARARDAAQSAIREGRWRGGSPPYGYRLEGRDLVIDEAQAAIVREVAEAILSGQSINAVCRDLNARGVPTGRGGQWRVGNLQRLITSERLLGHLVQDSPDRSTSRTVRGPDGLPVVRALPILDRETLERVKAKVRGNRKGEASWRSGGSLLLRVLYCAVCGEPMYGYTGGRGTRYYRCGSVSRAGQACGNRAINAEKTDEAIVGAVLAKWGHEPLTVREWVPGDDHAAQVAALTEALQVMRDDRAAGLYAGPKGAQEYREAYAALEARRAALEAVEARPGRWEDRATGQTLRDRWEALEGVSERNMVLRELGLRFYVKPAAEPDADPILGRMLLAVEVEDWPEGEGALPQRLVIDALTALVGSRVRAG